MSDVQSSSTSASSSHPAPGAFQYQRASTLATRALVRDSEADTNSSGDMLEKPKLRQWTTSSGADNRALSGSGSDRNPSAILQGQGNNTSNYSDAAMANPTGTRPSNNFTRQPSWSMTDKKREVTQNMIRTTSEYNAPGYNSAEP